MKDNEQNSTSGVNEAVCESPYTNTFAKKLDNYFKITKSGSTIKTEVIAGITTFMTMVYILFVNAGMFADLGSVSYGAVYIATGLSAIIGTVLIGLLAKLPLAQASGMGLNAFFVYTVCGFMHVTYANALIFVLADGVVFIILTLTGLRKAIFEAVPECVRKAIPAGIGLFIALIGLEDAGLVVANPSTGVALASFNLLTNSWGTVMPLLCTFIGFIAIAVLSKKGVKGAILWGILGTTVLYYILGFTVPEFYANFAFNFNIGQDFSDFGTMSFGAVFTKGFDFSTYLGMEGNSVAGLILLFVTTAFAFCIVDIFDTMGTLYGACARGNLLDEKGEVPNINQAMLADAIATCTGAICGTSTVTTFVESSAGIAEGGKTGFTSIITALGFLVFLFLSPVARLVPFTATGAALIYVGVLMMNGVKEIDWLDPAYAIPSFLTIALMPFTYNISYGIGVGIISYVLIKIFTGKFNEIKISSVVIGLIFAAMLFLTH